MDGSIGMAGHSGSTSGSDGDPFVGHADGERSPGRHGPMSVQGAKLPSCRVPGCEQALKPGYCTVSCAGAARCAPTGMAGQPPRACAAAERSGFTLASPSVLPPLHPKPSSLVGPCTAEVSHLPPPLPATQPGHGWHRQPLLPAGEQQAGQGGKRQACASLQISGGHPTLALTPPMPACLPACAPPRRWVQCGKFHALGEFDGTRRSCRGSLERHQQRRQRKRQHKAAHARQQQPQGSPPPDVEQLQQEGDGEQQQEDGEQQQEQQDGEPRQQPEQRRKRQRGSPAARELPRHQQDGGVPQERGLAKSRADKERQQRQLRRQKQQAQEQDQEQAHLEQLPEESGEHGMQNQQVLQEQPPQLQPMMAAPAVQPPLPPAPPVAAQPPQHPPHPASPLNQAQQPEGLRAPPALPAAAPLAQPAGRAWQQPHVPQVTPQVVGVVQGQWGLADTDLLPVSQPA